jgi:hypothetical protein
MEQVPLQLDNITLLTILPPSFPRISFVIYLIRGGLGEILDILETTRDWNDVIS